MSLYNFKEEEILTQKQEGDKLKNVSFWQYFVNLIEVIKLNNKTIQKVSLKEQVLQKILKHDSNCLDQMICALSEGNQNNLLVIFNVKQVFECFQKTLKQVKSFVEGISRWIQAQKFKGQRKAEKRVHKQKIINMKNCCHYCQQVLQGVRVNQLSAELNLNRQHGLNQLNKILRDYEYQDHPYKFDINRSVMKKYAQAQNYISHVLIQQHKRINQVQKYLKDHQHQTHHIKSQFNSTIVHDLLEQLLKRIKQKLTKNSRVKYEDILNEFREKLSLFSLQIQQKYFQKSKNSNIEGLFNNKQNRVLIKVKKNQNDKKNTIVVEESQLHELILKKQVQISQKSKQVEYFKLQMEKYKSISSRLEKQFKVSFDKFNKGQTAKNVSSEKKQSSKNNSQNEGKDVQTQIDQWQIIVSFNFLKNSQEGVQKVTNLNNRKNKNQMFSLKNSIGQKKYDMIQTCQQFQIHRQNKQNGRNQLDQVIIETKDIETQYQCQSNQQFNINYMQNAQQFGPMHKNRRKSVPKILLMQNNRKSKDLSCEPNQLLQILAQNIQINEESQQNSQKNLKSRHQITDKSKKSNKNKSIEKSLNKKNDLNIKKDHLQGLQFKQKQKQKKIAKETTRYKTSQKSKKSPFEQKKYQNLFLTKPNMKQRLQYKNINELKLKENQKRQYLNQTTKSGQNQIRGTDLNQNQRSQFEITQYLTSTAFPQKQVNFLQSNEVKELKKLVKLKQLKYMISPPQKYDSLIKHRRYNTQSLSDLNSINLSTTGLIKGNKKKNNFKKQILFNISDLQIFGGICQSFAHQKFCSKRQLSNSLQRSNKDIQGYSLTQKHELQDIQMKQLNRLYHYILALKQFKNAFYWNILSFIIKPYETVEKNQIIVQEKEQKKLKQKLQNLMVYHKKQCKSTICCHLKLFFNKIGFNSNISK